ncbi:hypothetical protein VNO78_03976 [Psophocarpus tetragonolobus]|uniref:GDSL esterase/lipase n=1 Tax=Psophocarpus tetragonolobus TaxID=3891 RepID=A0AAN9T196_PSOTE
MELCEIDAKVDAFVNLLVEQDGNTNESVEADNDNENETRSHALLVIIALPKHAQQPTSLPQKLLLPLSQTYYPSLRVPPCLYTEFYLLLFLISWTITKQLFSLLPHQFLYLEMVSEANTWLVMFLLFLAVNYTQHCVEGVPQVPCLFIFGDSLSDSGNNNELPTSAKSNYRPYGIDFPTGPTGRFTNGRTEIDIITQLLGFENFIPPFANTSGSDILKGVNYASGGAGIRNETGSHMGAIISLGLQLTNHRLIVSQIANRLGSPDLARQYLEKCLYYVNIGSNDYMSNFFRPELYPTSRIYTLQQFGQSLIEELSLNLLDLHDIGARRYVLAGLGLIGCTPSVMHTHGTNGSCVEEENAATFDFNIKLKALVDQFNCRFSANSKFIFINSGSKDLDIGHGFLISDAACCPSGCIPDQKPCNNRNDYVFWDEVHPTEALNLVNAIRAYNSAMDPTYTYPIDIKQLVHCEIKREFEFTNESTSHLTATE